MAFLQDWFDQHHLVLEDHQIYLNEKYIYYYLGALIPPQEVNLIGDQMREVNYQNIHFEWLPGPNSPPNFVKSAIEDEDVYIIQNYNDEYIQNLLALGFSSIYQNDRYTIYVNLDGLLPVATAETEPSP